MTRASIEAEPAGFVPFRVEVAGRFASSPAARTLAREVARVHHRYATEVVAAFRLCPFLKDPATAYGRFCVVLDDELEPHSVGALAAEGGSALAHYVFPLTEAEPATFERFGAEVLDELGRRLDSPPVMAVFHPRLSGDPSAPHKLVGLLRRAPDPFVQLVPEGLHEGGTVFAGSLQELPEDHAEVNFKRLRPADVARILQLIDEIRADRNASYAPALAALGRS